MSNFFISVTSQASARNKKPLPGDMEFYINHSVTRLKALENESELQPDIFQQEFPKADVKEETKQEVIGIPAWDSLVVEEEENPVTYNVNDIRFIDDFLGDQEDGEEETSLLVSTQKNKSKSQAYV